MVYSKGFKTLVLANTAEAFTRSIGYISNSALREDRIRVENILSQRAFFWCGDNKVVVTPKKIPSALFSHNCKVLGFKNVVNVSPKYYGYSLCKNILQDSEFLKIFINYIKTNPGIQISTYSFTKEFDELLQRLQSESLNFKASEKISGDVSVVSYLDSKSGFREVVTPLKNVLLPRGFICNSKNAAKLKILEFQKKEHFFVLKANEGESGWGLFIGKDDLSSKMKGIELEFKRDGIWKSLPYVVEEYIELDRSKGGGSPSSEVYVTQKSVQVTYNCGQLFDREGEFSGIALGKGILDDKLDKQMINIAIKIGKRYKELGYRGFFDVDFAVSIDNQLYILETNTRRTGGTHVYDLAIRIFGKKWKNNLLISNDSFRFSKENINLPWVFEKLKTILFPIAGEKKGLVLSLFDIKRSIMGYVLIGRTEKDIQYFKNVLLDIFSVN